MSYLTDYIVQVKRWIDDEDEYDNTVVTGWIRDAEERMNNELRCTEQIVREYATFDDNCALLPPDWLEHIYIRPQGGSPLDYISPHDYWDLGPAARYTPSNPPNTSGEVWPYPHGAQAAYTTIGQTLYVWPPIDPTASTKIEVCYFRKIVPLGDTYDPIMDRYPTIYRNCVLSSAAPYMIEDERLQTWASLATAGIQKANEAAIAARWSGSPIAPRIRGFG
jgi:hypothetical protein